MVIQFYAYIKRKKYIKEPKQKKIRKYDDSIKKIVFKDSYLNEVI